MRWRHKPKQSNRGEFGPDDEVGRLNLITPEKVLQGIAEVREGRTFCLSLPLDYPGGNVLHSARHPPKRRATTSPDGVKRYLLRLSGEDADLTDVVCDDQITLHTQYSTQWDLLAHIGRVRRRRRWRRREGVLQPVARRRAHRYGRGPRHRSEAARHRDDGRTLRTGPGCSHRPPCACRRCEGGYRLRRP